MMINANLHTTDWVKKSASFLLFFIVESMVFVIITFSPNLSGNTLLAFHVILTGHTPANRCFGLSINGIVLRIIGISTPQGEKCLI